MHKGHITYRGQKKKRFSDLTKKKQSTCFPFSLPFWRSDRNAMRYVNVTTICPTAVLSLVLKRLDAEDVGFLLFSDKIATIIVHWLCKHHLQRFSSKSLPSSTFLMLMLFVFIMKIACFAVLCYAPVSFFFFSSFLFFQLKIPSQKWRREESWFNERLSREEESREKLADASFRERYFCFAGLTRVINASDPFGFDEISLYTAGLIS